ncbi:MAG: hypothetical protein LQ345_006449 [Seirophora villosa]|nr:MAG: hypothetical protein LQ345_006449 [Seirophora villosa]
MEEQDHKMPRHTKLVAEEQVTSVLAPRHLPVYERESNADDDALAVLGYKPEFKRDFTLWTSFCLSFAVLGLLPSFASTLYYVSAHSLATFAIAAAGLSCLGHGLRGHTGHDVGMAHRHGFYPVRRNAELCSAMPTSGGLYYAAAVLAPPGWGPLASWLTGWSNWLMQVTGAPSVDYGMASLMLAAASIQNPAFVPQNYQVFLLTAFIMLIQACVSSMPTKSIASFNSYGSTLNIIAFIVVLITIPAATNRTGQGLPRFTPSSIMWGNFHEGTDFSKGVSLLMSFVAVIWTMSGYDAPFHLSEECSNANIASPRAIVLTSGVGGIFGWFFQLVVAYTVVDIDLALESELGQPFAAYLLQVLPQKIALAILALTILCAFSMGQGCMSIGHTRTPVNAVWLNTSIGIVMDLLIFGGPLAAGALFSIGAIAAFVAFTIPIAIRVFFVGNRFRPGPWDLGQFSTPIGTLACAFVLLMVPLLMLPSVTGSGLDAAGMNWTCLVYGGPMTFILIWWFRSAREWFKGPKVNIEHRLLDDAAAALDEIDCDMEKSRTGSSGKDGKAPEAESQGH